MDVKMCGEANGVLGSVRRKGVLEQLACLLETTRWCLRKKFCHGGEHVIGVSDATPTYGKSAAAFRLVDARKEHSYTLPSASR